MAWRHPSSTIASHNGLFSDTRGVRSCIITSPDYTHTNPTLQPHDNAVLGGNLSNQDTFQCIF